MKAEPFGQVVPALVRRETSVKVPSPHSAAVGPKPLPLEAAEA